MPQTKKDVAGFRKSKFRQQQTHNEFLKTKTYNELILVTNLFRLCHKAKNETIYLWGVYKDLSHKQEVRKYLKTD